MPGVRIAVYEEGNREGPTVVLVHGWPDSHVLWDGVVPLLAQRFALRTAAEMNKDIVGVSPEALAMLQEYDRPGNVRELQHAVERAVILSPDKVLQVHAFEGVRFGLSQNLTGPTRPRISTPTEQQADATPLPPGSVVLTSLNVDAAEQQLIERALDVSSGNRTRAAELLGMSIRTLRSKLNRPSDDDGGAS